MACLFSIDGNLGPLSRNHPGQGYDSVAIGQPLSIEFLTFYPGPEIEDWGKNAEIMMTSQIRIGSGDPVPRQVNLLLFEYPEDNPYPIQDFGGDRIGDPMLYYTKSYTGQRAGITIRGVEVDKISQKYFDEAKETIKKLGTIALFTPAAPYLGLAGIVVDFVNKLTKAVVRNDRIAVGVKDLYFDEIDRDLLQSGRYIFREGQKITRRDMAEQYRLTSRDELEPNILVRKENDERLTSTPYFVIKINAREVPGYDSFEIAATSAKLLEEWGDKDIGSDIFSAIIELGRLVNDANQLSNIKTLRDKMVTADSAEEKAKLKKQIEAHVKLFTEKNSSFVKKLLSSYLESESV